MVNSKINESVNQLFKAVRYISWINDVEHLLKMMKLLLEYLIDFYFSLAIIEQHGQLSIKSILFLDNKALPSAYITIYLYMPSAYMTIYPYLYTNALFLPALVKDRSGSFSKYDWYLQESAVTEVLRWSKSAYAEESGNLRARMCS